MVYDLLDSYKGGSLGSCEEELLQLDWIKEVVFDCAEKKGE